mmetsp:Transcript_61816/g.179319  ORF Transcript_61816/g.179319 Transcript_61816/m.179319 type:complete len:243 (-) Transcript_61816:144-872(-)
MHHSVLGEYPCSATCCTNRPCALRRPCRCRSGRTLSGAPPATRGREGLRTRAWPFLLSPPARPPARPRQAKMMQWPCSSCLPRRPNARMHRSCSTGRAPWQAAATRAGTTASWGRAPVAKRASPPRSRTPAALLRAAVAAPLTAPSFRPMAGAWGPQPPATAAMPARAPRERRQSPNPWLGWRGGLRPRVAADPWAIGLSNAAAPTRCPAQMRRKAYACTRNASPACHGHTRSRCCGSAHPQ